MSRRKDRERFMALKGQNPRYRGFRGYYEDDPLQPEPLQAVTCTVCGRRRNVSAEAAQAQPEGYVCLSCREDTESEEPGDGDAPQPG